MLCFRDFVRMSDDGSAWIEISSHTNWYSSWNSVVFDRCGLSLFCKNSVHNEMTQSKFKVTNNTPPVIYEHEFEWSLRTPWWCRGIWKNWGMASRILAPDTTSSVRSASCCGRFNVVPTEPTAGCHTTVGLDAPEKIKIASPLPESETRIDGRAVRIK